MEELVAVMDTVGSEVATVMAVLTPVPWAWCSRRQARTNRRADPGEHRGEVPQWAADHPFGTPREVADQLIDQVTERWGTEALVWIAVPSRAADERYRRWHARLQRSMASPARCRPTCGRCSTWTPGRCCDRFMCRRWSCIARSSRWSHSSRAATWPSTSRSRRAGRVGRHRPVAGASGRG